MPTFSTTATQLKYASSSSWTSGKARQGVYSSTRYEGAIRFTGLSDMDFSNVAVSQIQMKVTFAAAGGASTKYLTMYQAAQDAISGSISAMRGSSIGAITVSEAYNRTATLTFSETANSALYAKLKSYFTSGRETLILYVPSTRGTYSGGFCYDYLAVTAMTLTFTFEYLKSDGSLVSTSVAAGSAAQMNITAYNSAYSHRITWRFGSNSYVQSVAAGVTSASYTIPLSWLSAIPSAVSGGATAVLETLDAGGAVLGSVSLPFTVTAPSSVVPTLAGISASPVNTNSVLSGWNIYVQGSSKAAISMQGAAGAHGSSIVSYSITTSPNIGSSDTTSLSTGTLSVPGTVTVTAKITDSRGRTATKTATFSVYPYAAPAFSSVVMYRCDVNGNRRDTDGTYAYVKASFGCSALSGSNAVTGQLTLAQVGGGYSTSSALTSGTARILGGSLAVDATFSVMITLTDTVGKTSSYAGEISSATYIMHVKKGGRAVGFGMAAGADDTISFGWPVILGAALQVAATGSGVTPRAQSTRNLLFLGTNLDFQDTVVNWGAQGFGWAWYTMATVSSVTNKPTTYGFLMNIPITGATEVHQLYFAQSHGAIYHRGGNASGWGGNWKTLFDSATVVPISAGGTGQTSATGIRNAIGLGNTTGALPIANGGHGAASAKQGLINLGVFYSATLPSSGADGQVCLVPVS